MAPIIDARGLTKRFGHVQALDGLDLAAERGQVVAVLGPNGAGKTTFVRTVATLHPARRRHPARGRHRRARRIPTEVRRLIGLAGQYAAVEEAMTGRENLEMVARLFGHRRGAGASQRRRGARAARPDRRGRPPRAHLLGRHASPPRPRRQPGRRARSCCCSTSRPPGSTRAAASSCGTPSATCVGTGTDVLLTTQYLDEADQLASRDRHHRPRPRHRRRHARRAQGAGRAGRDRDPRPRPRRPRPGWPTALAPARARGPATRRGHPAASRSRSTAEPSRLPDAVRRRSTSSASSVDDIAPAPTHPRRGVPRPHRRAPPTTHRRRQPHDRPNDRLA